MYVLQKVEGFANLTQRLNLLCYKSPCTESEAKMDPTRLGPLWHRRCGYAGNVCRSCDFIDPSTSITIQGLIRAPINSITKYKVSDDYVEYFEEALKIIEYFMEFVLQGFPNYINESIAVAQIKYEIYKFVISNNKRIEIRIKVYGKILKIC